MNKEQEREQALKTITEAVQTFGIEVTKECIKLVTLKIPADEIIRRCQRMMIAPRTQRAGTVTDFWAWRRAHYK
ncbi:MAG TPA: hypothetical protein VF791_00370 [Pyrinomonadaceae bacterium]